MEGGAGGWESEWTEAGRAMSGWALPASGSRASSPMCWEAAERFLGRGGADLPLRESLSGCVG